MGFACWTRAREALWQAAEAVRQRCRRLAGRHPWRLAALAAGVLKDVQLTPNQILMQSNVARLAQADQTPGHVMNLTG